MSGQASRSQGSEPTAKVAKASGRGSKPGERRGGRVKGTPNKATASLKDIAREYTQEALDALVGVLRASHEPAAARVSAANAILDRGYGKPSQLIGGDEDNPFHAVHEIILRGITP